MSEEKLVLRGAEDDVRALARELEDYLRTQGVDPAALPRGEPEPVRRRMTEPAPMGNQALVELLIEIGRPVLIGVLTGVLKDQIVAWIKMKAAEKGIATRERD